MADAQLGHLFQRGAATDDWDAFSPEERSRLIHTFYSFFKVFESIYVHTAEGSAPREVWDRNCQVFFAYAAQPGCRHYWEHRRGALDNRFVNLLENLDAPSLKTGRRRRGGFEASLCRPRRSCGRCDHRSIADRFRGRFRDGQDEGVDRFSDDDMRLPKTWLASMLGLET